MDNKIIYLLCLTLAGCLSTKKVSEDPSSRLVGKWKYHQTLDMNGQPINTYKAGEYTVKVSGPDMEFKADSTYVKKFTPKNSDTGKWTVNEEEKIIHYSLFIDSTDFIGKDLIKKGLTVKAKDGRYYEKITDQIITLNDSILEINRRGMKQIFKKEN